MTSSTQLIGQGSGSSATTGPAGLYERGRTRRDEAEQAGSSDRARQGAPPALPGRDASPSPANVVRLPGQEGTGDAGPRRPLISGGAFTLAVAIGLSLDQSTQPDGLEPATPSSTGGAPAETGEDEADESGGLTEEEQEVVEELRARDTEVRQHEAAHAAAGGQYAGSPTFTYQTGPDGRQYAVGGEVSIDTAPVKGDPEATIRKAQQIKAAASAPADPSSQDRRVAAQAESLRQQARAEISAERQEESELEEAEAAEAEAARAGQQAASGEAAPGPDAAAVAVGPGQDEAQQGGSQQGGSQQGDGQPGELRGAFGFTGAEGDEGDEDDDAPAFAPAAFSAAAASYRGPTASPRRVSIAV